MTEPLGAAVVVVGAGPAGIAAGCRAAEAGVEVLLLDENPAAGGQIWRAGVNGPPRSARRWLERLRRGGVRLEQGVAVVDSLGEGRLLAERAGRAVEIRYDRLVVATGARELFLPFPGWTLPGVMGLGAAQALVKSGGRVARQQVVVAGSGPLVLPVAATLAKAGAELAVVAEQADGRAVRRFALGLWRRPRKWLQAARFRARFLATAYRKGTWVVAARGDGRLREVDLTDGGRIWTLPAELVAVSYGLVPNLDLPRLLGCEIEARAVVVGDRLETSLKGVFAAGEALGIGGLDTALVEGEMAGLAAAGRPIPGTLTARRHRARRFAERLTEAFAPRAELAEGLDAETVVCRCEDVRWGEIDPAWSMRQTKLYRRAGMGPCQARICGPILQHLCDWEADRPRPPIVPVAARVLASTTGETE